MILILVLLGCYERADAEKDAARWAHDGIVRGCSSMGGGSSWWFCDVVDADGVQHRLECLDGCTETRR